MELHKIYPAPSYVAGGTPTEIQLQCNQDGRMIPMKVSAVLLKINTTSGFTVTEIDTLGAGDTMGGNVIYATRIHSPCDFSVVYVAEYINDVEPYTKCCPATEPVAAGTGVWIDKDDAPVTDNADQGHVLYE